MFGGAASSSATLLGVPRTDGPPLPVFSDPGCRAAAAGCAGQRTVRSSSSDATSALQPPDSNPQSPSADNSSAQPRRTSDPLGGVFVPPGLGSVPGRDRRTDGRTDAPPTHCVAAVLLLLLLLRPPQLKMQAQQNTSRSSFPTTLTTTSRRHCRR